MKTVQSWKIKYRRIGKYEQGKRRPVKIKLKSQTAAEDALENAWRLAKSDKYKQVWLRREMNEEGKKKDSKLRRESKK